LGVCPGRRACVDDRGWVACDMRFLAWAMILAAAVFIPAALLILALDAGIGWLWAALGLLR
jgi:MATE family, multidrug efflux pump